MGLNSSGALNPHSDSAEKHATQQYNAIRNKSENSLDCITIARNTGFTVEQISLIKSYIFFANHMLYDGFIRFEPSYEMAESWRRLTEVGGRHTQPHDILMLRHELLEISYILQGYSQSDAHIAEASAYDYQTASDNFYRGQKFRNKP